MKATAERSKMPGLTTALDCAKMREAFLDSFPEFQQDLELVELSIQDVFYQPPFECTILYNLKIRRRGAEPFTPYLFTGQILRPDQPPVFPSQELIKRFQANRRSLIQTPVVYIPQLRLVLQSFPFDSALTSLFDAFDNRIMRARLNQIWAGDKIKVEKVRSKVLGYQPNMRAAFLYEAACKPTEADSSFMRFLVGKIHVHKDPSRLFACSWAIAQAGKGSLNIASPVGYIFPYRLSLQEKVEGKRLGNMVDSPSLPQLMRETARQIAALHRLSIPLVSCRTPKVEAEFVSRWARLLMELCPDFASKIKSLNQRITSALLQRTKVSCPVHGDFQNTNVLVHGSKITLIDLDEVALGDPLSDVGRLLSSMRIPALRQFGDLSSLEKAHSAFLEEYLNQNPEDERRARLFEAGSLLISAGSTFRRQRTNWRQEIPLLLEESERMLRLAGTPEQIIIPFDSMTNTHPVMPFEARIRWIQDATYVKAMLEPFIHNIFGAEITHCQAAGEYAKKKRFRARFKLSGRLQKKKWKNSVQIMTWREQTGRNLWFRLSELRQALEGQPDAPALPRPIAYLSHFPLVILEDARGVSFSSLILTSRGREATQKAAKALALFHDAKVKMHRIHPVDEEVAKIRNRIKSVEAMGHRLASEMMSLFKQIEQQIQTAPERVSPVLRSLRPHSILVQEEKIIFTALELLSYSHPFIDAANFLAHMTTLESKSKRPGEVKDVANHFRSTYRSALSGDCSGLGAFEAGALLRMACSYLQKDSENSIARQLLNAAQERLTIQ